MNEVFETALEIAVKTHKGQVDKNGVAFILCSLADLANNTEVMAEQVARFIEFAREHPRLTFYVTEIGCGVAGYTPGDVVPLFAGVPENVVLPAVFCD